jgi:hypothetical protein
MPMSVPILILLGSVLMPHLVKPENIDMGFGKQLFETTFVLEMVVPSKIIPTKICPQQANDWIGGSSMYPLNHFLPLKQSS